jgi:1,2-diacylglycerol 3-beta-glucosyltransferase
MAPVLALALAPVAVAIGLVGTYLMVLTVAAARWRPRVLRAPEVRRFAVLVPAHDEAGVIARLLRSLRGQYYPRQRVEVFVVADNCSDTTAAIARRGGAVVYERRDEDLRAKGHALRWLLDRVRAYGRFDAYVVFDADSVVGPDFLSRMDGLLEAGSKVIQGQYGVLNASASPLSALRDAAFASLHYVRPLGRHSLGLSCGLKGNGMCFDAATLDAHGWTAAGLAEDVELHLALVRAGLRVDFAPGAIVRADMPTSLRGATSQNMRWEAGRLSAAHDDVPEMLLEACRSRDLVMIDACVEQLIPPLSVAVALGVATSVLAALLGASLVSIVALAGTLAIVGHVMAGLFAVKAPWRTYLALFGAPPYIAWKLVVYLRAITARSRLAWIRTPRS